MTWVVTGGAGFIGSNFIAYLLRTYPNDRVVCLDKLTYAGNLSNLSDALDSERFRFVCADICDRDAVYSLFEQEHPDIVVNLAAESHVDRSIADPSVFLRTNVMGIGVIMDACCRYRVPRFHQVSTDEVYGDLGLEEKRRFTEDMPLRASSPYAASKASADLLAMSYHRTYGLPVTISRCSNNYGPKQFPEKLIPLMIWNALHDLPLPVYGTGKNVRDWLHVEDHCRALDRVIQHGTIGEIYNIGGCNELCNLDMVKRICAQLNKPESLITFVEDRKGHDLRYAVDCTKLQRELDWKLQMDFSAGLCKTIQWYVEHWDWMERIFSGEEQREKEQLTSEPVNDIRRHTSKGALTRDE